RVAREESLHGTRYGDPRIAAALRDCDVGFDAPLGLERAARLDRAVENAGAQRCESRRIEVLGVERDFEGTRAIARDAPGAGALTARSPRAKTRDVESAIGIARGKRDGERCLRDIPLDRLTGTVDVRPERPREARPDQRRMEPREIEIVHVETPAARRVAR